MSIFGLPSFAAVLRGFFVLVLFASNVMLAVAQSDFSFSSDEEELLPEDEAFAFSTHLLPDGNIEVRWDIADGYYMYRDKMSYDVAGETEFTEAVLLPAGKSKDDDFFGKVDVYVGTFSMVLPIEDTSKAFTLLAMGQGCNDPVGVCYPPITLEVAFDLTSSDSNNITLASPVAPSAESAFGNSGGISLLTQNATNDIAEDSEADTVAELRDLLGSGFEQPEYLDVDDAFKLALDSGGNGLAQAAFEVAPGYYMYQQKLSFVDANGMAIAGVVLPEGVIKDDEYLGRSVVYKKPFSVPLNLSGLSATDGMATVVASYQGCAEEGICYPPVTKTLQFDTSSLVGIAVAAASDAATNAVTSATVSSASIESTATGKTLFSLLLGAFAAGLLLTFTPCVLPLIPILSGVIAGQGEQLTKARGGLLAVIYVLGTAATYAFMGALAGASGEQLQAYFQNIWAIGILAIIFVVMALSMFGLFTVQMPSMIQARLTSSTNKLSGAVLPVFILGLVSALIVGACVSPVLISFLGIAMTRGDALLGAQMMFVMALGMGLPLIALGFGAGYLIPKAGMWMDMVKHFFGIMLIGVAIYMLGVLPMVPVLLLWGVYFIVIGIYLNATQSLPEGSSGWMKLGKGFGTVLLVWGILALVGGFMGQRDVLKPLPDSLFSASGAAPAAEVEHVFTAITSNEDFDAKLAQAQASGKSVILDFYADWCVDCIKMEKSTFIDPQVVAALKADYVAIQIDVTDPKDPVRKAVQKRLGVFGPPAILFFDEAGNKREDKSFYGYLPSDQFLAKLAER